MRNAVADGSAQLQLTLGTVDNRFARPLYRPLCNGSYLNLESPASDASAYDSTGFRNRALLQNEGFRSCIPGLAQVTSFRLQSSGGTSRVSFCMDDIQLLPSTLRPTGRGGGGSQSHWRHMWLSYSCLEAL